MGPFAIATEFCEATGITLPSDLARLQSLLRLASAEIRNYCDQTLSRVEDDVITLYPSASTFLSLPERPVIAATPVTVNGVATTSYYVVTRGLRSGTVASPGSAWTSGATVTYTHGYAESDWQFDVLRSKCIDVAARAFTHNEGSSAVTMGAALNESAGYVPEIFLTQADKEVLRQFRRGPVR